MRQVYTCSVLWLLVGSESAFIFMHFVGAEGLVMIRLEHAGQVCVGGTSNQPTRCVTHRAFGSTSPLRIW